MTVLGQLLILNVHVLAERREPGPNPLELRLYRVFVDMPGDGSHLAVIVFPLHGSSPRHGDDLGNLANGDQIVGNVRHDVADADDGHALPHGKLFLAERGEEIIMVDEVLRMIHV